ncbi:MAG: OmpA family protein [Bacteroidales bacterium]|nr:OmpA family protein [Bacteroidales bacterium]MCI5482072.1 OmpA family protein [Bacteroidales bacterium]
MKKSIAILACAMTVLTGCATLNNLAKGSLIGGVGGGAVGAGVGAAIGGDKGAAIGAAIGTAVGAGAGAIIGNVMDKKAEELAALEAAQVETVEDANGLKAIKVTFDSGILFATNKSNLSAEAKSNLKKFADEMKDLSDTDITIYGHTDNTGSAEVNERLSLQRANAVSAELQADGIAKSRITTEGKSFTMPVADNSTAEGRAQNRRVEVFISANQNMIAAAENGELK